MTSIAETDNFVAAKNFDRTGGSGSKLPFKDPNNQFLVYSVSHKQVPPIATDPKNPAIRVYGTFPTRQTAQTYATKLQSVDPTCSILLSNLHDWVLVCDSLDKLQDQDYITEKSKLLLKRHHVENSVRHARFKQHQDELRNNKALDEDTPVKIEQSALEKPEIEEIIEEILPNNLPVLTADCMLANQSVICLSFIKDEPTSDNHEFMFYAYRACKDEDEAGNYVKDVASRKVDDHDIYVVETGQWVFPLSDAKHAPKYYRDKRLHELMNRNLTHEELLSEIDSKPAIEDHS